MQWVNKRLDNEYLERHRYPPAMPTLRGSPLGIVQDFGPRLIALISNPWFFQIWTVQECALVRDCRAYWDGFLIRLADIFEFAYWTTECTELADLNDTGQFQRKFCKFYITSRIFIAITGAKGGGTPRDQRLLTLEAGCTTTSTPLCCYLQV